MSINNCICESIILGLSLINIFPLSYILIKHVQKKGAGAYRHSKFRIIVFMLLICVSQTVHYGIAIPMIFRVQFSFGEVLLKNIGAFQVVYFVFKKAAKPLGSQDKKKWLDIVKYLFLLGFGFNIFFLISMEINFWEVYNSDMDNQLWETRFEFEKVTCSNFFWLFNSMSEVIQTCIFYYVVNKIEIQVLAQIKIEIREYGYDMDKYAQQLKNLENLWFIIKFNIFANCYVFLFTSLTLVKGIQIQSIPNIVYEKSCNVITGNIVVDEYLWLIKRATNFLIW